MRNLSPALRAHLDSGATTLCHCWKLTPARGGVLGFSDHDEDLVFDGVLYRAQSGFSASEIESSLGLSVDNLDAAGALSSSELSAERLHAGDFDNAEVEIWRVNWQDISQRILLRKGNLGEVSHGSLGFSAEVRGLAHVLNQPQGRIFQAGCDANLGDQRCTVDLTSTAYQGTAVVTQNDDDRIFTVSGLDGFPENWFDRGRIAWLSGLNAPREAAIKFHRKANGSVVIETWEKASFAVVAGDSFKAFAGCDKQFGTCQGKFGNTVNFRGFPHMPGEDFVLSYASKGDPRNDGKKR